MTIAEKKIAWTRWIAGLENTKLRLLRPANTAGLTMTFGGLFSRGGWHERIFTTDE
jgi:hypothetical protein